MSEAKGKVRVATVWLSGCSGCHMSLLDLDERLLELARKVELVYSPVVDIKGFPDGVDVTFVEGAVGNAEHLHLIQEIRKKSRLVVALGDCAVTGNVPSMRNPIPREEVLHEVYGEGEVPGLEEGEVPKLLPRALPLSMVVPVDGFLHGCPPPAERIWRFIQRLLSGEALTLSGEDLRFG
ncbi:MAG: NADH ubiquinone oxidoreductase, 20 kDa subunit [Acetothermia bacterium 64_32]|nr:MAG: NADH ubiquinone oxidoreductase, 20 kDa subunit [Acetothermia bacterium 64_32]